MILFSYSNEDTKDEEEKGRVGEAGRRSLFAVTTELGARIQVKRIQTGDGRG
jgi:hypothetical protein